MDESRKIYKLGNDCEFITDNPVTIAKIEEAEEDILEKASANQDPKMDRFYDRIQNDADFRTKKVVTYVLNRTLR